MKHLIAIAIFSVSSTSFALSPLECDKVEYAELRDMTKSEMAKSYCTAVRRKDINDRFYKTKSNQYTEKTSRGQPAPIEERQMMALVGAKIVCMKEEERVAGIYQKKFKAKPPVCPE